MSRFKQDEIFGGRYKLIQNIGIGGFSEVWLAEDEMAENSRTALKIFAPESGLDDFGLDQFRKEYALTSQLTNAHLLKASHYDIYKDSPYLVMPYCEAGSLYKKLKAAGTLDEREVAKVLNHMADALDYLHSEDILHRDIKPENILMDKRGNYLLADFGISSNLRNTMRKSTNKPSAMTLSYSPPEMFDKSPNYSAKSDIFSLGVLAYELCSGDTPWMGAGGVALLGGSEIPEIPNKYSDGLANLVEWCMMRNPMKRPTAAEVEKICKTFLDTGNWPAIEVPKITEEIKPDSGRRTEMFKPNFESNPKPTPAANATIRQGQSAPFDPKSTVALQNADSKKKKSPVLLIIIIVVVLGGGAAAFFMLNKSNSSSSKEAKEIGDSTKINSKNDDKKIVQPDTSHYHPPANDNPVTTTVINNNPVNTDAVDPNWKSKYSSVSELSNGLYKIISAGKAGLANSKGKVLLSPSCDFIGNYYEGFAVISKGGKYGFVNGNGNIAISCKYDYANDFDSGHATVKKDGITFVINTSGTCVQNCPDK